MGSDDSGFDASAYWQDRVGADADLAVVGHRAMGPAYNAEIYARRIEALELMLQRHIGKPLESLSVLDIGCGSGFYTGFWQARGVRDYVGLDISSRTIDRLANAYPEYRFVHADITEVLPDALSDRGSFDIITVFDVLYHIIDKQRFEFAVANIGALLSADGRLLVMDWLCHRDYRISMHVIYRARDAYLAQFRKNHLVLTDSEPLFHLLLPPFTGIRVIDYLFAGIFRVISLGLRLNGQLSGWAGAKLRQLDARMRTRGVSLKNGELLAFARNDIHD